MVVTRWTSNSFYKVSSTKHQYSTWQLSKDFICTSLSARAVGGVQCDPDHVGDVPKGEGAGYLPGHLGDGLQRQEAELLHSNASGVKQLQDFLKYDDVTAEPETAGHALHKRVRNISDTISECSLQIFENTAVLEKIWTRTEKRQDRFSLLQKMHLCLMKHMLGWFKKDT